MHICTRYLLGFCSCLWKVVYLDVLHRFLPLVRCGRQSRRRGRVSPARRPQPRIAIDDDGTWRSGTDWHGFLTWIRRRHVSRQRQLLQLPVLAPDAYSCQGSAAVSSNGISWCRLCYFCTEKSYDKGARGGSLVDRTSHAPPTVLVEVRLPRLPSTPDLR
jgi:hypothetical protein